MEIPEANASAVRVVWTDNLLAGCELVDRVSTGVVSAAQLRSPSRAAGSMDALPAEVAGLPAEVEQPNPDESSVQTAIVIVTSIISVLALILFLAAILPPS